MSTLLALSYYYTAEKQRTACAQAVYKFSLSSQPNDKRLSKKTCILLWPTCLLTINGATPPQKQNEHMAHTCGSQGPDMLW